MKLQWRLAALKNGFADATAYQIEFLFEFVGEAIVPAAIQLVLWYAMFKIGGATSVAGMSFIQMIHYTLTSVLFTQVRGGNLDFELAEMIRNGQLSNYLLRPVGVVEFVFLRGVAPKLFIAGFCLLVGLLFGWIIGISPVNLLGSMLLAVMGNVIHYQLSSALAAVAFSWEEAFSVLMVKNLVVQFLSGELLPLNLFPASMQWLWKVTPFYLYVYGPTQYALGNWSHTQFLQSLAGATLWLVVGWTLVRVTWGVGIKRYLSLGG